MEGEAALPSHAALKTAVPGTCQGRLGSHRGFLPSPGVPPGQAMPPGGSCGSGSTGPHLASSSAGRFLEWEPQGRPRAEPTGQRGASAGGGPALHRPWAGSGGQDSSLHPLSFLGDTEAWHGPGPWEPGRQALLRAASDTPWHTGPSQGAAARSWAEEAAGALLGAAGVFPGFTPAIRLHS